MRTVELILFGTGALALAYYTIATLYPGTLRRLERVAERRSNQLKSDFLWLSSKGLLVAFVTMGGALGCVVYCLSRNGLVSIAATPIPAILSGMAVKRYRTRRVRRVISQLPSFLETLSGYIKAGHSLPEAISSAIPLLPRGIREEIAWLFRLNRLGMPLAEAFIAWERRMPSPELSLVARPMRIALSTGGNIVSLLERARDVLRARQRQQDKMRSMTAQARLQALVLTMLPPLFLLVLSRMEEGFLEACTGTATGRLLLLTAATLQLFGWLCIRKILSVKPC